MQNDKPFDKFDPNDTFDPRPREDRVREDHPRVLADIHFQAEHLAAELDSITLQLFTNLSEEDGSRIKSQIASVALRVGRLGEARPVVSQDAKPPLAPPTAQIVADREKAHVEAKQHIAVKPHPTTGPQPQEAQLPTLMHPAAGIAKAPDPAQSNFPADPIVPIVPVKKSDL